MKCFLRLGLGVLFGTLVLINTQSVAADRPYWGPDPERSNPVGHMVYVVSRDGYTNITRTQLEIYSPVQNPDLRIYGKNLCSRDRTGVGREEYYSGPFGSKFSGERASGNPVTSYRVLSRTSPADPTYDWHEVNVGTWDHRRSGCNDDFTAPIPLGYGQWVPEVKMFRFAFRAEAITQPSSGYYINSFRILLENTNGVISQDPNYDVRNIGMQYGRNALLDSEGYIDHAIPFAMPCGSSPETATIEIYDDDLNDAGIQANRRLDVRLRRERIIDGVVDFPSVSFDTNSGRIVTSKTANEYYRIRRTAGGSGATITMRFSASPAYRYTFAIRDLYSNNTLQLYIPYSKVNYYADCDIKLPVSAQFEPLVSANPTVPTVFGQNISFNFRIQRSSSTGGRARVTPIRTVWLDSVGDPNSIKDPGEPDYSGCFTTPGTPIQTRQARTYDAGVWAPGGAAPGCSGPAVPAMGAQICATMDIGAITPNNAPPIVPPPSFSKGPAKTVCIKLGKKPYFYIKNGNLTAGGEMAAAACSQSASVGGSKFNISAGGTFGAYGDAGIKNIIGQITTVGSLGNVNGNDLHFANSGADGNFGGQYCLPDGTMFGATTPIASDTWSPPNPVIGRRIFHRAGDLTITGNAIFAEAATPQAVPQLVVIVDGDLKIPNNVTRLDGIFIVKGNFISCEEGTGPSPTNLKLSGPCDKPLTVNGPLIVNGEIFPGRTYGAVAIGAETYSTPAETFNLHPNVLVGEYERASTSSVMRTVRERELPPRN